MVYVEVIYMFFDWYIVYISENYCNVYGENELWVLV